MTTIYSKAGADAATSAAITALGLGTAAQHAHGDYATTAQGAKADASEVQQVTLTAPLAYTLPVGVPAGIVHRVVFTQDGTGGHTVTYGGAPVTVDLTAGASTRVELWPVSGGGWTVSYPSKTAMSTEVLRSRLATAAARAAGIDRSVMTSPPTVATSTTPDAALTKAYAVTVTPSAFALLGGRPVVYATNFYRFPVVTLPSGAGNVGATGPAGEQQNANGFAAEFMADADVVQIRLANATTQFQVEVDGRPVGAAPIDYPATSGTGYVKLTFTSRAVRRIRVEALATAGFRGADVGPTGTIWAPPGERLSVACLGDSIAAYMVPEACGSWCWVLGKLMGWQDVRQVALPGTGFTNAGTYASTFGSAARVADVVTAAPSLIVVCASSNDPDTSATNDAALATFQAYRAALPTVPIVVAGIPTKYSATYASVESRVKAAFDAWADANSYWVPMMTDTSGAWIAGTGKVGGVTNDGNADLYIKSDDLHPVAAGHAFIGTRLAHALRLSPLLARHTSP